MNKKMTERTTADAAVSGAGEGGSDSEFQNLHEIVKKARHNLDQNKWDYIVGGTETETTLRRNRMALDSIAFRPRVLRDVRKVDASLECLGRKMRLPIILAPIGALECFDEDAGAAVARAAEAFGVAHMLSSVSEPGLENVARAAPGALRLYQLYVRGDDAFVDDHVERAIAHGYTAFCLTVDTAIYSRRERDLAKRYVTSGRRRVSAAAGRDFQAGLDWRTVERIKGKFNISLMLKGIATAEDAKIACDHGVEWIYVSNHGGRQLDHGRGSLEILPEIVQAAAGSTKIVVDGGISRGTDIVKAIGTGADLVGIGRLQCYALAAAGQAGVLRMLELLEDEVQRCLGLLGVDRLAQLDASYLHPATPVNPPGVLSAFPLLDFEDYRY